MSKQTMLQARHELNKKVAAAIRRASKADFYLWELHDALWPNDYRLMKNKKKSERMSTDLYRAKFLEEGLFERVDAVLRLCEGKDSYEPFLEEMETLGVVRRQARWTQPATLQIVHGNEPVDIVFITHRKGRPKTGEEKQQREEEQAQRRLDAVRGARLRAELMKPNVVRVVWQDGGEERHDSGEGWRAA